MGFVNSQSLRTVTCTIRSNFSGQAASNSYVQLLARKLDFLAVYDIKWRYFEWRLQILKVLISVFQVKYIYIWLGPSNWATNHHHSSRGCKNVTFQIWKSFNKADILVSRLVLLSKSDSAWLEVDRGNSNFLDLKLLLVTVLQPLELWWCIITS